MRETIPVADLIAWRECADCGLFQRLPEIPDGEAAVCARCGNLLRRAARDSVTFARTCAVLASLLFVVALTLPLVDVTLLGRFSTSSVFSGPDLLRAAGFAALTIVILGTLVMLPAARLALEVIVLFGVRAPHPPRALPWLFAWGPRLAPWAMVDVFLLGSFVAYTRLKAISHVDVGLAALALGGVMLTMVAADATLDREAIWQELEAKSPRAAAAALEAHEDGLIGCDECGRVTCAGEGEPCARCHHPLEVRRAGLDRVWALVLAAGLLYIPANVLPVMTVTRLGKGGPSTILNGVVELGKNHLWPLALLVLLASIVIPVVKLVSLVVMLVTTHLRARGHLFARTRLYRFVKVIGRWSMIDIFMLSVLVGVVRFGAITSVTPGLGAVAFCGVVLLTMVATEVFDPRLMWDAAGREEEATEAEPKGGLA